MSCHTPMIKPQFPPSPAALDKGMERYRVPSNMNGSTPYISFPPKPTNPSKQPQAGKTDSDPGETEISIFNAERYFNGTHDSRDATKRTTIVLDSISERRRDSLSTDEYERNYPNESNFYATPTASSEASWNSQSMLLKNPPGSIAVTVKACPPLEERKPVGPPGRWFFRRKCPCSGKKSVSVQENCTEPKTPVRSKPENEKLVEQVKDEKKEAEEVKMKIVAGNGGKWGKDREIFATEKHFPDIGRRILNSGRQFNDGVGFSFPILTPPSADDPVEDPPRDSLEVFRPLAERKSGEGDRRSFAAVDDDAASDTSSDLFEIESLSTQMTWRRADAVGGRMGGGSAAGILQLRQSLEAAAAVAPPPSECYAPSEASVEWSVTTAEGFDRSNLSTAGSEYGEFRFIQAEHDRFAAAAVSGKRRGGGLLNCVCEKAVSVGPVPVRAFPDQTRPSVGVLPAELDRLPAKGRFGGGGAVQMQERSSVARSYSARMCRPVQTRFAHA